MPGPMTALLVLSQFADSHPFDERRVSLQERERVHVGRCNGMNQPSPANTIFDCKVLSRNHALLWYENGKFWLQDTKSSNGTFVNSNRIGKVSVVSEPYELHSRDVIQFGVSVTENAKKTTHECIISEARLFHPDGQEALQNTTIKRDSTSSDAVRLYELTECLQEASHREELIEKKVTLLQQALADIYAAAEDGWKAMIDEDRLLAKIEALEEQLSVHYKDESGDADDASLKRRLADAYERLARVEETSRATYTKILDEKLGAMRRINELEPRIGSLQEETSRLQAANEASRVDAGALLGRQQEALLEAQARSERWEQQCALSVGEAQSLQQKMDDVERENHSLRARLLELTGKEAAGLTNGALHGPDPDRETAIISDDLPNGQSDADSLATDSAEFTPSADPRVVGLVLPVSDDGLSNGDRHSPTHEMGDTGEQETIRNEDTESMRGRVDTLQAVVAERDAELQALREETLERRVLEFASLTQECERLRERVRHIEEEMADAKRENVRLSEQLRLRGPLVSPVANGDVSDAKTSARYSELLLRRQRRSPSPAAEVEELKECLTEVCRGYDNVVVQNRWMSTALCCPIFALLIAVFIYSYSALTAT